VPAIIVEEFASVHDAEHSWSAAVDLVDPVRSQGERRDRPAARTGGRPMPQYMLSVHVVEGGGGSPMTREEIELRTKRIGDLEADMRASNTWRFSARLHDPDTATVVRQVNGQRVTTDGPFAESKEHLGGFYVIEAADLDEALDWAERTVDATGMPIEVWPFFATADR
jgi:hypothetical protein